MSPSFAGSRHVKVGLVTREGSLSFVTSDASRIGEVRRAAASLAEDVGLDQSRRGALSIVVSEAAQNIVRHARGDGEIVLRALSRSDSVGVEVLAIDRGPGIRNLAEAQRDGFSTAGTPGTGLGAISRLATEFDLYSNRETGTVLLARVWDTPRAPAAVGGFNVGAVCLPKPSESECGDAWAVAVRDDRTLILVADGLGHGFAAAEASRSAVRLFNEHTSLDPLALVTVLHAGLRSTRGAAVAVAEIRATDGTVRFVGVGNISALLASPTASRSMVSHNGTAGVEARRIQEFVYPWRQGTMLVLHSDGLSASWDFARYRGIQNHDAAVVAAALYRDHRRLRDDVTVLVLRTANEAV